MSGFAGTGVLLRHILRRDRVRIAGWVISLPVLAFGAAQAYLGIYPTVASRQGLDAQFGSTKAIAIITGPVHGLDTVGGFTEWRLGGSLATLTALMALFMVVRHTRADEESGRTELIAAGGVGRLAPLTAALLATIATCLLIGAALAAVMIAVDAGTPGSVAFGLATALAGVLFASVAAVTSQLSTYARTASALAGGALGAVFVLRGLGDSTDGFSWLSWLSPVGWAQQLRPYNGERWWVLLLSAGLAALLVGLAFSLQSRRDVGAGLIERSTGPATAAPALRTSWALAWRQHRTAWLAWLIGGVIWSLLFGSLANAVADIASTSPQIQVVLERMGGSKMITQTFIGTAVGMMAMILAFFIAQALLRAREEEATGRVDLLLSTPVHRTTWLTGHVVAAYAGIATMMLACGAAIGLTASLSTPDASFSRVLGTAAAHIPALWIIAGACLCVLGWLPRRSALMWVIIGLALSISMFGQVLNAPEWVLNISPFSTAPAWTDAPFAWATLGLHLAIAATLTLVGMIGVRRRDLGT